MERFLMDRLLAWKDSPRRKPLLLNGARQVGKTWLLREFGRRFFDNVAYVSLDHSPAMRASFELDFDVARLVRDLSAEATQPIEAGRTLVILDEIGECPSALTSLKYFCEEMPQLAIAAAGSLLGIRFDRGTGFPVGKVDMLDLRPMSFREFLDALGQRELRLLVDEGDPSSINAFSHRLTSLLRNYLVVGGMPEALQAFVDTSHVGTAREIQSAILAGYEADISKHLKGSDAERAIAAWNSIPAHLGRENKRFVFSHIRASARARDFEAGITWLEQAGIAIRVPRVSEPLLPLRGYADNSIFKLFALDVGLLGAMADLDPRHVLEGNSLFEWWRGALTEQYVCQELLADLNLTPFYWSAQNSSSEADFLAQHHEDVYLIEVKGGSVVRSKSLRTISERFNWLRPVRLSPAPFVDQGWMRNIPLYAMGSEALWKASDVRQTPSSHGERETTPQPEETTREDRILELLERDPTLTYDDLARELGVGRASVARSIHLLRGRGLITREGNPRSGRWTVREP